MAKKGMNRSDETSMRTHHEPEPVPEIQGAAKSGKEKARPIVAGTSGVNQKVFHSEYPIREDAEIERPIPEDEYPAIDNDLARDNLQNDIPDADLNEL